MLLNADSNVSHDLYLYLCQNSINTPVIVINVSDLSASKYFADKGGDFKVALNFHLQDISWWFISFYEENQLHLTKSMPIIPFG